MWFETVGMRMLKAKDADDLTHKIRDYYWSETPFMWFATVGMRLLKAKDADDLTQKIREVR